MNIEPQFSDFRGNPIRKREPSKFETFRRVQRRGAILTAFIFLCVFGSLAAATQINLVNQVKGILPTGNGGTGTASTLSGIVRGGSAYTAAELSGDVTTSGSNVATVVNIDGTSVPTNSSADQILDTTASATGAWKSMPNCTTGAIQYSTSTHAFSCGTVLTGTFSDAETPSGTINGSNTAFTLAHTPNPSADLELFLNGQQLIAGGADYTLATAAITMTAAPKTGDVLIAFYRY